MTAAFRLEVLGPSHAREGFDLAEAPREMLALDGEGRGGGEFGFSRLQWAFVAETAGENEAKSCRRRGEGRSRALPP